MKIVIAGGGDLGYYLTKTMLGRGHEVSLIEISMERATDISTLLDEPVVFGNATEIECLRHAQTEKADVFIAVTGRDEDNLIACQLAKRTFNVSKTIARSNNPSNVEVLKRLGIDFVLCASEIITRVIEQEADSAGAYLVATLNHGEAGIYEYVIDRESPVCSKAIVNVELPRSSLIVSIIRGRETIIPRGGTQILAGDKVVVLSAVESVRAVQKAIKGD